MSILKNIFKFKKSEPEERPEIPARQKSKQYEDKDLKELIKLGIKYLNLKISDFENYQDSLLMKERSEATINLETPKILKIIEKIDKEKLVKELKKIRRKDKRYNFSENDLIYDIEIKDYFLEKYKIDVDILRNILRGSDLNSKVIINKFMSSLNELSQKEKNEDLKEIAEKVFIEVKKEKLSKISNVAQIKRLLMKLNFDDVRARDDISLIREIVETKLLKEIPIEENDF